MLLMSVPFDACSCWSLIRMTAVSLGGVFMLFLVSVRVAPSSEWLAVSLGGVFMLLLMPGRVAPLSEWPAVSLGVMC